MPSVATIPCHSTFRPGSGWRWPRQPLNSPSPKLIHGFCQSRAECGRFFSEAHVWLMCHWTATKVILVRDHRRLVSLPKPASDGPDRRSFVRKTQIQAPEQIEASGLNEGDGALACLSSKTLLETDRGRDDLPPTIAIRFMVPDDRPRSVRCNCRKLVWALRLALGFWPYANGGPRREHADPKPRVRQALSQNRS